MGCGSSSGARDANAFLAPQRPGVPSHSPGYPKPPPKPGCIASGARDANTFVSRNKSAPGPKLPPPSAITCEGVFYQHPFESGNTTEIFEGAFNTLTIADPLSGKDEHWLGIGLNSRYDGEEGQKNSPQLPLTLIFVLDVSGSMRGAPLESAKTALKALLGHLTADDFFALVTFDTEGKVIFPLQKMADNPTRRKAEAAIDSVRSRGGTDFMAGWNTAMECLTTLDCGADDMAQVWFSERRVFFLTDMNISVKTNSQARALVEQIQNKAEAESIFTTIIGFGVNFDVSLTDKLGKAKGCNYHSVLDHNNFIEMMKDDFKYLVRPNAFDIRVVAPPVENDTGVTCSHVYGAPSIPPEEGHPDGTLVYVNSSFPSAKVSPIATKGGIVLAKLEIPNNQKTTDSDAALNIECSYATRDGKLKKKVYSVPLPTQKKVQQTQPNGHSPNDDQFGSVESVDTNKHGDETEQRGPFPSQLSIQKAVLLTKYVNLMKHFLQDDASANSKPPTISEDSGITHPAEPLTDRGVLQPKVAYLPLLQKFETHFASQMELQNDKALDIWLAKLREFIEQLKQQFLHQVKQQEDAL